MRLNQAGIDLVKRFEGLSLTAYPDPGTGGEPVTIGYGTTGGIRMGDVCTQEEAEQMLARDLEEFSKKVSKLVTVELNDNQFSALVSFAYNLGAGNLRSSTLLKLVNESDFDNAANEFPKWDRAAGKVMQGLLNRRLAEKELFLLPIA